jgi:CMD domain protein
MTYHDTTLVERLAGIVPGSPIDTAWRARAEARRFAEDAYGRLLHPRDPGPISLLERRAVAAFVAVLNGEEQTRAHLLDLLRETDPTLAPLARLIEREAEDSSFPGPYGSFPPGPLSAEDLDGPVYVTACPVRHELGLRLSAALEYAHLVTLHPRDASPESMGALAKAGWTNGGIALLVDIIGFVNFQSRVVAGLRSCIAARAPQLAVVG